MAFERKRMLERAKSAVRIAMRKRDNILMHTVCAIEEINKSANLLYERLREWYGLYSPEFRVADPEKYCEGVLRLEKKEGSIGIELPQADLEEIKRLAIEVKKLYELRAELEAYEEALAKELCPNLSHLCEAKLAAKLVGEAGSLERLALLPASTVQLLGAEKALFKHLRSGTKPPKHGVIFQHPLISSAPKKLRGKLSRALAAKIAIAAKADAFTENFIAEKLKEDFEKRAKKILG